MRKLLGRLSDAQVARRLEIGVKTVTRERRRLGIPPAGKVPRKVLLTPALRRLLARPTVEVVARTGLAPSAVFNLRRKLGVPAPPRRTRWTPEVIARLGRVPDAELAAELGLSVDTVKHRRSRLGIYKDGSERSWTPQEDSLVRQLSPHQAARRTGRHWRAVLRRRRELGLEEMRSPWTAEEKALLGKESDTAIAARLGITHAAVRFQRIKLGIPARWRGRPPKQAAEARSSDDDRSSPES